jgi:hypothetical protein
MQENYQRTLQRWHVDLKHEYVLTATNNYN